MRRTLAVARGAKGYGWYGKYRSNPEEFSKFTAVTPFDWSANANSTRPTAFFEVHSGGENWGKLEFELASDILPKTVDNFVRLVTGDNAKKLTYSGTKLHQVRKGVAVMGGDVEGGEGKLSHSAFADRFFLDENFIIPNTARGLLSMATVGVNTNGSQFYISLNPLPHLNGRSVVFGRLISGEETLAKIEKIFAYKGTPVTDVVITSCGVSSK